MQLHTEMPARYWYTCVHFEYTRLAAHVSQRTHMHRDCRFYDIYLFIYLFVIVIIAFQINTTLVPLAWLLGLCCFREANGQNINGQL